MTALTQGIERGTQHKAQCRRAPRHWATDPDGCHPGGHRLSGSHTTPSTPNRRMHVCPWCHDRHGSARPTARHRDRESPRESGMRQPTEAPFDVDPCLLHCAQAPCQEACEQLHPPHRRRAALRNIRVFGIRVLLVRLVQGRGGHDSCTRPASDDRIPIDG